MALDRLLEQHDIHIAVLSELRVTDVDAQRLKFDKYSVVVAPRTNASGDARGGGGVAILIASKLGLAFTRSRYMVPADQERHIELCHVTVHVPELHESVLHVSSVYCPRGVFAEPVLTALSGMAGDAPHILAGDFNMHSPLWDPFVSANASGESLAEWFAGRSYAVANVRDLPTRVTVSASSSQLTRSSPDVTAMRNCVVTNWHTVTTVEDSRCDHLSIVYDVVYGEGEDATMDGVDPFVNLHVMRPDRILYMWKKADWPSFADSVDTAIQASPPARSVTGKYLLLKSAVHLAAAKHCPRGAMPPSSSYVLYTDAMKEADATTRAAFRDMTECRPDEDPPVQEGVSTRENARAAWLQSIATRDAVYRAEHSAKFRARCSRLTASEAHGWRFVKNMNAPARHPSNAVLVVDGRERASDMAKSRALTKRFSLIAKRDAASLRPDCIRSARCEHLVTAEEVDAALQELQLGKAAGPDELYAEQLRRLGPAGRDLLRAVVCRSLESATVPSGWREAHIIPLAKPETDPASVDSYRPIALTSVVAKLAERVVLRRLLHSVEPRLTDAQSGFRPRRGTSDEIARLFDTVHRNLCTIRDGGRVANRAVAVFVDFSKAFDMVDHAVLIRQLCAFGVDPMLVRWVRNFLTGRCATVRVGRCTSKKRPFSRGVPQGTVLGPILFAIYTDELSRRLSEIQGLTHGFYADDLSLFASGVQKAHVAEPLQRALAVIDAWSRAFFMAPNRGRPSTRSSRKDMGCCRLIPRSSTCACVAFSSLGLTSRWPPRVF